MDIMKKSLVYVCGAVIMSTIACTEVNDYYPLAEGNTWVYQDSAMSATDTIVTFYETEITGHRQMHNKDLWVRVTTLSDGQCDTTYLEEYNNYVFLYINDYDTIPDTLLSLPLEQGKTWTVNYLTIATVKEKLIISVPAGTFFDCWRIDYNHDEYYFAPDVGMVKMVHWCSLIDNIREMVSYTAR
jgi:hypothetical protein